MSILTKPDWEPLELLSEVRKKIKLNQFHAVSRTQQDRESSVKTLRSPLSAKVWKTLRVEWRNSTPRFCLDIRAKE